IKLNGSLESDYLSRGIDVWFNRQAALTTYGAQLKMYFADLRWGWFNKPYLKPTRLVYPAELRDTSWFDSAHRSSYNLFFLYQRALTPDLSVGIYPALTYQRGLLSTPFHRVYFAGRTRPAVERLPDRRRSASLSIRLNKQFAPSGVMRSAYQVYTDNFGMTSHALHLAFAGRVNSWLVMSPSIRIYHQEETRYFAPYQIHAFGETFYTSDYDLSRFWSTNLGVTFSFDKSSLAPLSGRWQLPRFSFRYAHYRRSDGMRAHLFSTLLKWNREDIFDKSGRSGS
ncbi:MAG: DUF3570 domain-containing protein, partial [Saprospiraceae bacterium]|nr:DUF3570 domain-containing protein [Saprospiraceae bacterium]